MLIIFNSWHGRESVFTENTGVILWVDGVCFIYSFLLLFIMYYMQPIPTGEPCQQVLRWWAMQNKDIISLVLKLKICSILDLSSSSETDVFAAEQGHNLLGCSGCQSPFSLLLFAQERRRQQRKGRWRNIMEKVRYFWSLLVAFFLGKPWFNYLFLFLPWFVVLTWINWLLTVFLPDVFSYLHHFCPSTLFMSAYFRVRMYIDAA